MNWVYRLLAALTVSGTLAALWLYQDIQTFLDSPVKVSGESVSYEIQKGDHLRSIANKMQRDGLIDNAPYFVWYSKLNGYASRIKVGEYAIESGITVRELLNKFVKGVSVQYAATIIEGWNIRELLQAIQSNPHLKKTLNSYKSTQLIQQLGLAEQHPEGLFLPDTYHFPKGTTDVEFLQRAYQAMQQVLKKAWYDRGPGLPYKSSYEALIMASIVEKETAVPSERAQIAGVFVRRLKKNMRLQTDPTVIYGLGESFNGNIKRKHLQQKTPYNTYRIKGLPPTPIAMPGKEAIQAALNPAPGKSLYFVARGDGSHKFSATLDEHNKAVIKYQLKGKARPFSSMPKVGKAKN